MRIFGFKTFAERVEFDLNADIIAIVGPNGCGKSNIVDAILWGLGEPNARNLRATSGVDVIFNGSAKRKPLGYAEVTLLFDNEDGLLPLDAAEVAITRKITRAGESHFSINRRTCRLKDIYDLLADSGLGRAGYAIVGQSEIDQALSASAEERRAWIDEAAGVQRFRSKRVESLRRLEAARDHLTRIDQIISDIEFQREPLKEEAEAAKRFQEIRAALSELETNLLVHEIQGAQADVERLEQQRLETSSQIERLSAELASIEANLSLHGAEVAEVERKLDAQRELRQSQLTAVDRAEASMALAQQRLTSLDELENSLTGAKEEGEGLVRDAESDLEAVRGELAAKEHELREVQAVETSATEGLKSELEQLDQILATAKAEEVTRLRQEAEVNQARMRQLAIEKESAGITQALAELTEAIEPMEAKVQDLNVMASEQEAALREAKLLVVQLTEAQAEASQQAQDLAGEISVLGAKRRGLEATLDNLEGLGQGAKAVIELARRGELAGTYTPVSSAVEVEERYAIAIETALGGAAHDLITQHDRDAKAAIEALKRQSLGRATFQPLNLVKPMPSQARGLRGDGVVGVAADLVRCKPEHQPVFEALLGRIVVVETLDHSIRLAGTKGWNRLVTLDGEVVHSGGAVTGGRSSRQGTGIVQRRAELAAITDLLAQKEDEHARQSQARSAQTTDLRKAEEHAKAVTTQHEGLLAQILEATNWLHQLQRERLSTEREGERLAKERANLSLLQAPEIAPDQDLAELGRRRDQLVAQFAAANAEEANLAARQNELRGQVEQAQNRVRNAETRLERARSGATTRTERLGSLEGERSEWMRKIEQGVTDRDVARAKAEQLKNDLELTQSERSELLERGYRMAEDSKDADQRRQILLASLSKLEIERARSDSRRSSAAQRLLEDYGITEDMALQLPVQEIPDDAQPVVSRLRRDLKALGDVNVGAIEAYERLTMRSNELGAQREDVWLGIEELHGAVKELDRLTKDRFLTTFDQVKVAFAQAFVELFGGGEAELSLTQTEEVISAGVQVNVTVPGKKRQRLELLSGGERSMSAVAFLFALLRVKPSPLVVLDEVDAPLDGRNVERFAETLKSFAGTTQFLVITHNPVTIEVAPLWFGVTMQEPGCTSVLPYTVPAEVVADSLLQAQTTA